MLCGLALFAQNTMATQRAEDLTINSDDSEQYDLPVSEVEQVVVTATGTPRRLKDSPIPISVITNEELQKGNILTLEDALIKLNPSFSVMTNGMGTTMSMNGLSDDYILFLLNGKRMNGANPYTQVDMNRVKRIEILSGASAVLYGTNAIGGVVNIVTEEFTEEQERDISGSLQSRVSSYDRYINSMDFTVTSSRLRSTTSFTHNESGSWQFSPYVESGDELVATEKQASVGYSRNLANQEFEFIASDKLSFNARASYYDNITKRPYSEYTYDMYHQDYTYGIGAELKLKDFNRLEFDFYSDNYTSAYDYLKASSSAGAEVGDRITRTKSHYYNANARGYFFIGDRHSITTGFEAEQNTLESVSDELPFTTAYTLSLFAQDEIRLVDNFYLLAGVRLMYHQTFNCYATPHASLRYSLEHFNFRASYSSGFRTPTLSEIYSTTESTSSDRINLANPDLQPEKSNYFSVNAEYNNRWMSISATGFFNDIRDMIDYETILTGDEAVEQYGFSTVRIRSNVARAQVLGANVSLNLILGGGVTIGSGYTWTDTEDLETGEPINRSVRNVVTANAMWSKKWKSYNLNISLNGRYNDERYSSSYGYAPSYQIWDFTTHHTFKFGEISIEPTIGVENLFNYIDDRPWNSNYATLTAPRSVFAAVVVKF